MNDLEEKILKLPEEAKKEVDDFIDFLIFKYYYRENKQSNENDFWIKASEKTLKKIWDNREDDVYNELYKG
ncbi:MAG: DUF2281 domain-containing protein [Spirochaetales bacterium]|nr:DUF2281 domain-containing protein [Spirochaetales bacterium]